MRVIAPFGVPRLLVCSPSAATAEALAGFCKAGLGEALRHGFSITEDVVLMRNPEVLHARFHTVAVSDLFNSVCVVDLTTDYQPTVWRLHDDTHPLRPTELVLAYPEVYWVFVAKAPAHLPDRAKKYHFVEPYELSRLFGLLAQHQAGFRPLFDPAGLRRALMGHEPASNYGWAAEDETSYCLLNGYSMYRRGFSTFVAPTASEFRRTVKEMTADVSVHSIEDIELQYPDLSQDASDHGVFIPSETSKAYNVLEFLQRRTESVERLRACATRTFISTLSVPEPRLDTRALAVLGLAAPEKKLAQGQVYAVAKPYSGFYDPRLPQEKSSSKDVGAPSGFTGHSAPGTHQELASHLLQRCRDSIENISSPQAAVTLAVLATVAERLLVFRTTHMSLEAIALRHRCELEAECLFIGMSNRLDILPRLEDIQQQVGLVTKYPWKYCLFDFRRWWKTEARQNANAMLEICGELRAVFQRHNRHHEEFQLLEAYRRWIRRSILTSAADFPRTDTFIQRLVRIVWFVGSWLVNPIRAYLNLLMRGPSYTLLCSFLWITLFAALYQQTMLRVPLDNKLRDAAVIESASDMSGDYGHYWLHSLITFVSVDFGLEGGRGSEYLVKRANEQPALTRELYAWWIFCATEMACGFLHLAAFIATLLERFTFK